MRKLISGIAAAVAAGGLVVGASAVPSQAGTAFKTREFDCYRETGCLSSAEVPSTWRHVKLAAADDKFLGSGNQFVRFRAAGQASVSTLLQRKQKALKGTKGLKVVSVTTRKLPSGRGMDPMVGSTIVYTYTHGRTTRWVANRYLSTLNGEGITVELTVAGSPKNAKYLGTVLARGTYTFYNGD